LRTADPLVNLIAESCLLSSRLFWVTVLIRSVAGMPAGHVFSEAEPELREYLIPDRHADRAAKRSPSVCIPKLARLGGCLVRNGDLPTGS
jgi:hypothetical protein